MTPQEKALVKETWRKLEPKADTVARLFYDRLFEIDETTRPLFKAVDLLKQRQKLIHALSVVVQGLDNLDKLVPTLTALGGRHVQYGVTDRHYESVGAALLWTLKRALEPEWTSEAQAAWSSAYGLLTDVMKL